MSEQALRAAYEQTSLHRFGIPFEQAMQRAAVREFVEAAARRAGVERMAA